MKAQVLQSWGGPLALVDRPRPTPQVGEVLVAVRACGVGLTVLNYMSGQMGRPETLPRVPGHEITGVVAEVGPGVTAVRPGDRVLVFFYLTCGRCEFCRGGRDSLCREHRGNVGVHCDGGYAEFVALPEANVLPLPEGVPFVEGTTIPDAIATPYHVCASRARVRVGDRVLVIGAGGGVGIHMLQMARLFGARVVAVDVDDGKLARCREFGAEHAVNFRASDAEAQARTALEGGATVAVDLVGREQTLSWALGLLGRRDFMLLMAGKGGPPPGAADRVLHLGFLAHSAMPELLAMADLVALPQRRHPVAEAQIPAKVFEAMAMAKPVVATAVSDLPEILAGCGIIVEPENVSQLAAAIEIVLTDCQRGEEMGERARERHQQEYSWDAMEVILAQVLRQLA